MIGGELGSATRTSTNLYLYICALEGVQTNKTGLFKLWFFVEDEPG